MSVQLSSARTRSKAHPVQPAPLSLPQPRARTFPLRYLLLLSFVLLFLRRPDAFLNPQFYAEDGRLLFMNAQELGVASLLSPYHGGYYFAQRLVAYLGTFVSIAFAPHFYNLAALCITLGVVAYLAQIRINSRFKPLLALAVVAIPTNGDMFMRMVNIHWILALGLLALLISKDASRRRDLFFDTAVALPVALTGPFSLLWLPLFAVRAALRRSRGSFWLLGVVAVGAGVQFMVLDSHRSAGEFRWMNPNWFGHFGYGISGVLLLGMHYVHKIPNSMILVLVSLSLYVALTAHALAKRDLRRLLLLAAGMAVLLSTAIAYRRAPEYLSGHIGNRYAYLPTISLVWALILTLETAGTAGRCAVTLLGLTAVASLTRFQERPFTDYNWREASLAIGGLEPAKVPINPPGWSITYFPDRSDHGMAVFRAPLEQAIPLKDGGKQDTEAMRTFALRKRTYLYGIRFHFASRREQEMAAKLHVRWDRSTPSADGRDEGLTSIDLRPGGPKQSTVWVFDEIDQFIIRGVRGSEAWEISGITLYVKPSEALADLDLFQLKPRSVPTWLPISGDWDGDGNSSIGLFYSSQSRFFLSDRNAAGEANRILTSDQSRPNLLPIAGDWNGDGIRTPAVYDSQAGTFYLESDAQAVSFNQGVRLGPRNVAWVPLAGDWDGDGDETVGLYDPATSQFLLLEKNEASGLVRKFRFGRGGIGWLPVMGDWNGNGRDTVGLYDPKKGKFYLRNSNTAGAGEIMLTFGPTGSACFPVAGDWNGDWIDTVGLYLPREGKFLLHTSDKNGSADTQFRFGPRQSASAR